MKAQSYGFCSGSMLFAGLMACFVAMTPVTSPAAEVDFEADVEPILSGKCYKCHGEDTRKSEFRTDRRSALLRGGNLGLPAVVPGDPEESELLHRVRSDDSDVRMPLNGKPLSDSEILLLETWISEGAVWPGQMDKDAEEQETGLWSMQPVQRPAVPETESESWGSNPVDAFIWSKLEDMGLQPNSPAEPRTLIRRAAIVLTGLPPEPQRIDAFLQDWQRDRESAYENLIDELLASPHFGERWAQHWLDVIRWAESSGSESNYYRKNAWYYRDYVIQAFNEDKAYDRFVREQLAGDLFGQDAATGFLVAGPHVPGETVGQEESAKRQARYDRLNETVQSVGVSMMGLTLGCARCHNHKFDPVSIQDYYSMVALFQDIEYDHRVPELPDSHPRAVAGKRLMAEIEKVRDQLSAFGSWRENWVDHYKVYFRPVAARRVRITFDSQKLLVDEIEIYSSRTDGDNLALASRGTKSVTSRHAENPAKPPSFMLDNRHTGFWAWRHEKGQSSGDPWIEIELPEKSTLARLEISENRFNHYATTFIEGMTVRLPTSDFKIEVQTDGGSWQEVASTRHAERLPAEQRARYNALSGRVNELAGRYDAEGPQPVFIGRFRRPEPTHLLYRGSPMDPRGEVEPRGPAVLQADFGLAKDAAGPERRKAIADWLVSPDNPLTARVMVNRLWYHVFGAGIVSTPGDFGNAGAQPTHPELLDWLATTFVDDGWSMKSMVRRMVTSQAFKQSSLPREKALALDGGSQFLWRFPPRWVEAEVIRDAILLAAGTLDRTIGGQSYRIHNVKKRFEQWRIADNAGPETWRRMIYQERMRGIDDMMFTAFDLPDCGQIRAKRPRSTTPLQVFNLMNGRLVLEQSEELAARVSREAGDDHADQVRRLFMLVLGRGPEGQELEDAIALVQTDGLKSLARVLFNTSEFIYLN